MLKFFRLNKLSASISSNREVGIILLVLMVLTMMLIPLYPWMMDGIIAINLSLTLIVLMVVIYINSPLELSSFPSILLVLALVRIGITVSTSRLILMDGDAGEMVHTFGTFVAGGNLAVGVIIFLIITIINFIVITKGSERVAEVGARFSLDAMPGKQMSIDSDLRAGNITMKEAKDLRQVLIMESKFFGAMDGAMKFVKGDAIASIIDIVINLFGGVFIGVLQKGLPIGDAIQTYCILTIGDGLIQQIPSLVIALTSGILITHTEDGNKKANVGNNIITQVFKNHKAIFAALGFIFILAFIPGMPSGILSGIFIVFTIIAFVLYRKKNPKNIANDNDLIPQESSLSMDDNDDLENNDAFSPILPLHLTLSKDFKTEKMILSIRDVVKKIRGEIQQSLGIQIPHITVSINDSLATGSYQLFINEVPVSNIMVSANKILVLEENKLVLDGIFEDNYVCNSYNFGENINGVWVDVSKHKLCEEHEIRYMSVWDFIYCQVKVNLINFAPEFFGIQEVKSLLDGMVDSQDLIRELLRMLPLNKITEILQRLVCEGISIRNFKPLLDTMLEYAQFERSTVIITEEVRKSIGRYIAYKFSNGNGVIACFLLNQEFENIVRDSIRMNEAGGFLSMDPHLTSAFLEVLGKAIKNNNKGLTVPLTIVTQFDIRRYVRSIIEARFPEIPVLSLQELDKKVEFNVLGILNVGELDDDVC